MSSSFTYLSWVREAANRGAGSLARWAWLRMHPSDGTGCIHSLQFSHSCIPESGRQGCDAVNDSVTVHVDAG